MFVHTYVCKYFLNNITVTDTKPVSILRPLVRCMAPLELGGIILIAL